MASERTLIMKKYRPEQIVEQLRQAHVELGKGPTLWTTSAEMQEPTSGVHVAPDH